MENQPEKDKIDYYKIISQGITAKGFITVDETNIQVDIKYEEYYDSVKFSIIDFGYAVCFFQKDRAVFFVGNMVNKKRETHRGVGTLLLKSAIDFALEKNESCKILLDAVKRCHIMYYRMGFRAVKSLNESEPEKRNLLIENEIKRAKIAGVKPNNENLGLFLTRMELDRERYNEWN